MFKLYNPPYLHVCGLGGDTGLPGVNPLRHAENMHKLRTDPSHLEIKKFFLLRGDIDTHLVTVLPYLHEMCKV